MKKVSILERGGKAYKNYSKCWQSENTGKTVKSLWFVTNQVGTANAFHVLGFYLPRVPDVEGKGHNTTTPIRNPLVLVLLNFTLAYKYNYPRRYIEKQWTKKTLKYQASEWQGGTGDQHLYKAVLPQKPSVLVKTTNRQLIIWDVCIFLPSLVSSRERRWMIWPHRLPFEMVGSVWTQEIFELFWNIASRFSVQNSNPLHHVQKAPTRSYSVQCVNRVRPAAKE